MWSMVEQTEVIQRGVNFVIVASHWAELRNAAKLDVPTVDLPPADGAVLEEALADSRSCQSEKSSVLPHAVAYIGPRHSSWRKYCGFQHSRRSEFWLSAAEWSRCIHHSDTATGTLRRE